MRKRSEANKPKTKIEPPAKAFLDFVAARYAWRERYAISIDGGATFKTARRNALADVPGFEAEVLNGDFNFPPAP